ncbi:MAG: MgtC/SapB transporter [Hydrocarboniphaga sp.]|uniref:MgtC/SapB family protein n=1 Tax=Hydrocarboniphaga sp. TaxID=2033016 RepID=UPI00261ADE36|nr:MgtC/SapB family protein [Hydrocarboniphaga sp.]MDB5969241.1 MgtC/SapB transporter [Hydrocarboniphaga sp.]
MLTDADRIALLHLACALGAGIALGLNRDLKGKPIGVRTLGLVALACCTLTEAALQFGTAHGQTSEVVSRSVQGLMAGIGFLGGGVILHTPSKIHGLTTAAMVWLTAALGVACGLGALHIVAFAVIAALALVLLGGPFERTIHRWASRDKTLPIEADTSGD